MDIEYKGYWSDKDKEIWVSTDWKARDYNDLPIEEDTFEDVGHFYGPSGEQEKRITFIKYIRANPIYPPFYGPVYTSELLEFMKQGGYCYPMYDGKTVGSYDVHDRFDSDE